MSSDKHDWHPVTLGEVVQEITNHERDPESQGLERYVGLDHLDPGDPRVRRWGLISEGVTFTKVFSAGQILFGKRRVYQKKVGVPDFDGICSGDIIVLDTKDKRLSREFLALLVQTDAFFAHAEKTSSGSLSPRTKFRELSHFEFPLPPLQQQRELVELMQGFDAAIEAGENMISAGQSVFNRLVEREFGYASSSLPFTDLCNLRNGLNFSGDLRGTEGVKVIDINAIPMSGVFPDYSNLYSVNIDASEKDLVRSGDLLIIRSHANKQRVGTVVMIENAIENASFSGFLIRARPDFSKASSKYLTYFMRSDGARRQIVKGSGGTNINNINRTTLSQVLVPMYPIDMQIEIVQRIDIAADQISEANEHLNQLRNLKSTVLNISLYTSTARDKAVEVSA